MFHLTRKGYIYFVMILCFVFCGIGAALAEEVENEIIYQEENIDFRTSKDFTYSYNETEKAYFFSGPIGEFAEINVEIKTPGVYEIYTNVKKGSGRAIYQLSINSEDFGERVDANSSTMAYTDINQGEYLFETPGTYRLRYTIKGINENGGGYALPIKNVRLVRKPIIIKTNPVKLGNIFYENEEVILPVLIKNGLAQSGKFHMSYEIVDDENNVIKHDEKDIELDVSEMIEERISFQPEKKGNVFFKYRRSR